MNIVCCTDNNYVIPCGVLITSVCENNSSEDIKIYILTEGISLENQERLKAVVAKYGKQIEFYTVDKKAFANCPISRHITLATYFRLIMTDILPQDIEKVLYLDCDIVVRHSLHSLWNTDIDSYAAGVIPDMSIDDIRIYNRLQYPSYFGYFNAGVLLVNLRYWREKNLSDRFFEIINQYPERLRYHDQDVLNITLREIKLNLHMKYNVQHGYFFKDPLISRKYWEEREQAIIDPVILHYSGNKPWFIEFDTPYKKDFAFYLNTSGLDKSFIRHIPMKARIKAAFRSSLEKLGFITPKDNPF